MEKKPAKMEHLANWYYGNKCAGCGRIDPENEEYGHTCWEKLHKLKETVGKEEMTHKEYTQHVKTAGFCKPTTREFQKCPICEVIRGV